MQKLEVDKFSRWLDEPTHNIAVLLPTRGRTDQLRRSVMSLLDLAHDPKQVQIMLGMDKDDPHSIEYVKTTLFDEFKKDDIDSSLVTFDPMGYIRLNEYVNVLARYSDARWLMFWNDDAVMQSRDWDLRITEHDGEFCCLRMPTHNCHPYAIFPIVPVEWYRLLGHLSPHQISDAWISQTAYLLNIMKNIDVDVIHDRHDLTGNNNDDTYKNRVMLEGRPEDPRDFNHVNWRARRVLEANKIAWFMKMRGADTTWFSDVMSGRQDPWSYMLSEEQDPNKQIKKFA